MQVTRDARIFKAEKRFSFPMKILIIQTAFVGDVVLITPLIEKLKRHYPGCQIDLLVRKGNQTLFNEHPLVQNVWVFDKKKKIRNLIPLIRTIRSQSYEYVINVHRYITTGLITCLSKGKVTIGFDKNPLSLCYTHRIKHVISKDHLIHEVERNIRLIENITNSDFVKPRLYPSLKDEEVVPAGYEYICMAPASTWFTKMWPVEHWCALISKIPEKYKIHLIGGPDDVPMCEAIREKTGNNGRVIISAGKMSFLQSVAMIKHAKFTFTNDSAPAHFASACNAPVGVIFCSTVKEFGFGPLSDSGMILETSEKLDCRPCGLHGKKVCPLGHFKCSEINIDEIVIKAGLNDE